MSNTANMFDVAIAGAGPAGTSAAIHLATQGMRVFLGERKKFPRPKLCGEFISPECLDHFEQLGVADRIISAGGARLTETIFYARDGRSVSVPSEWFAGQSTALGLSRAEMDNALLERAREVGVQVLDDTPASGLLLEGKNVRGIRFRTVGAFAEYQAPVTIDATGRTRALARHLDHFTGSKTRRSRVRAPLIAFKAHLENARVAPGACEIYFYAGGYGGLSSVEGGLSNLCFIASAKHVRRCGGDAETVMRQVVFMNSRAGYTLAPAQAQSNWLAVTLENFGRCTLVPADGLLTIGDAAAFIDPFAGSGMLMALESGQLAATVILEHWNMLKTGKAFAELARDYRSLYSQRFNSRLRVCAALRQAAFVPRFAESAILLFSFSDRARRRLARATRSEKDPDRQIEAPS
jgi:menaquinone-9 beta-reductase